MNAPATPAAVAPSPRPPEEFSQWQLIWRKFRQHRLAVLSLHVLLIFYAAAVLAEFVAPSAPGRRDLDHAYAPPQLPRWSPAHGWHVFAIARHVDPISYQRTYVELRTEPVPLRFFVRGDAFQLWGWLPGDRHLFGIDPSPAPAGSAPRTFYFLGADKYGRDIFSRLIHGARISLSIGLVSIVVTFVLGILVGGVSGYAGGRTDVLIQRVLEIISSFPQLPLWLALAAVMPADWSPLRTYAAITVVLSLLGWTGLARVVRGKVLALREEDYVCAARLLGASHARILLRHLLPGMTSHIIVVLTLSIPGMILGETALSFLNLGLRPPIVSWGVMLQDCMQLQAVANYPWLLLPVVAIVLVVLCFNFLGDGLRDAADPYASR